MKIHMHTGSLPIHQLKYQGYFFTALGILFFLMFMITWIQSTIRIFWISNSRMDVLGYNVLRWDNNSDQYVRINASLIADNIDPLRPAGYSYIDQSPPRIPVVNYRIQEIRLDGSIHLSVPIEITKGAWSRRYLVFGVLATSFGVLGLCLMCVSKAWNILYRYDGSAEIQAKL